MINNIICTVIGVLFVVLAVAIYLHPECNYWVLAIMETADLGMLFLMAGLLGDADKIGSKW